MLASSSSTPTQVLKNKEEGTELFKGSNFRPAAARYNKALTHATKFIDLSPEQVTQLSPYVTCCRPYVTQLSPSMLPSYHPYVTQLSPLRY